MLGGYLLPQRPGRKALAAFYDSQHKPLIPLLLMEIILSPRLKIALPLRILNSNLAQLHGDPGSIYQ